MTFSPLILIAVATSAVAAGALAAVLVRPPRRLAGRVRPYTVAARTRLGRPADAAAVATDGVPLGSGLLRRLVGPIVVRLGRWVAARVDGSGDDRLLQRLRHADLHQDLPETQRVAEYRFRQAGMTAAGLAAGVGGGYVVGVAAPTVLVLGLLGAAAGALRPRAQVDRAITDRRERMRIELYTVNQLLALDIRVGGGVVQSCRRITRRGHGEVVRELRRVLRAHASGVPAREAFGRAAATAPEPHLARTLRLLASGAEYGADLADALLAHSDDVRDARREALRRAATRRRAAMLVPIIGVLAPVMLLFIAAPLPSLVFGVQ